METMVKSQRQWVWTALLCHLLVLKQLFSSSAISWNYVLLSKLSSVDKLRLLCFLQNFILKLSLFSTVWTNVCTLLLENNFPNLFYFFFVVQMPRSMLERISLGIVFVHTTLYLKLCTLPFITLFCALPVVLQVLSTSIVVSRLNS